jgi:mono/diheme cytochrome c family protein
LSKSTRIVINIISLLVCFNSFSGYAQSSPQSPSQDFHQQKAFKATPPTSQVLIKMWTSRDSGKKQSNVKESVDIGGLYFDNLLAYDIQYEQTKKFKGLKLRDLISQYKPIPEDVDFVLLHSKRGMIIPVNINSLRDDTDVFIALAMYDELKKSWFTTFESSVYSQPGQKTKVSLPFGFNKMVVGGKWRNTDFAITPWRFFDSLAGIEFVSSHEHYKALEPKSKGAEVAGRSVYMRRCQYCHGIGEFGATFAPRFDKLMASDKKLAVEMVLNKVLPAKDQKDKTAKLLGVMPKQSDFTKSEAKSLVDWVQKIGSPQ